jgi:hypothetical protein
MHIASRAGYDNKVRIFKLLTLPVKPGDGIQEGTGRWLVFGNDFSLPV